MTTLTTTYTLANGVQIPVLGFGTWQTPDGDTAIKSVKAALEAGYLASIYATVAASAAPRTTPR